MGTSESFPADPPDLVHSRVESSKALLAQRVRRKSLSTSMVKRAISSIPKARDPLTLPEPALLLLLQFLVPDLNCILQVSAFWHYKVLEILDNSFAWIESQFSLLHSPLIEFRKSYLHVSKLEVSHKQGLRIDRIIVASPLKVLANHTIKLRYTYRNFFSPNTFKAEYKFDCVSKKRKVVWAHRDECRFHGEDIKNAYTEQISSVQVGDEFEICMNWYNLLAFVRIESIEWEPPLVEDTRAIIKSLELPPEYSRDRHDETEGIKKKLYYYNITRYCEVELNECEWYDVKYYKNPKQVFILNEFSPFLKLIKTEFSGIDVVVSKNTYKAENTGIVPGSLSKLGIQIEICEGELSVEVKRLGLLYDRNEPLELRVGDEFVFYISRGG